MAAGCDLEVGVKWHGAVCVLAIGGELDIATAGQAAALAAPATTLPAARFVLDLSGLRFVDGHGARALAALAGSMPAGIPVVVRSASHHIRRVLQILGLDLERQGKSGGEWLLLESQVLRGWAQQTRTDSGRIRAASQVLASRSQQLTARSGALSAPERTGAGLRYGASSRDDPRGLS